MIPRSLWHVASSALLLGAGLVGVQAAPQEAPGSSPASGPARACNNSPSLCGRQYNKITYMGAHDSSFLRDSSTGNSIAGNQFRNATAALEAGLRLLQAQVHRADAELRLCHSSCGLLDAGPLDAWLTAVAGWMGRNPNEVVTLVLVNADSAPASELQGHFERSGMAQFGYKPSTAPAATSDWPTLETMISQGTRLVSFVTNMEFSPAAPYLLPQFNYVFETAFEVTQLTGFNCTLDRPAQMAPASNALSRGYLSLVNHFKYQNIGGGALRSLTNLVGASSAILVPDVDRIDVTNSPNGDVDGNLGRHVDQCRAEWQQQPNFVLVDFWDRQSPIAAADRLNALSGTTGRRMPSPVSAAHSLGASCQGLCGLVVAAVAAAALLF
ncbi:hypothetical protein CDD81_5186 [Ophiocordyceps australis]|uniref:Phosphatidylinositol-specific phospholipase C X domain-containing protein n=1 Tax=Ophiocordyceps australis TaxID=1399860 RepID=A0A2C5Y5J3_9HYPO|nr:hypothetical protein CDD81_5186 [Ophiocordyceps australis]